MPHLATDLHNFRVAILLPTAGENLEVVFKALVGSLSQRLWDSGLPESQTLRVVVLDEKRRVEVYRVCAGVHKMGSLIAGRRVRQILMVRGFVTRGSAYSIDSTAFHFFRVRLLVLYIDA